MWTLLWQCPLLPCKPLKVLCFATLPLLQCFSWVESQNHSCLSFTANLTCSCVVLPLGWVTSTSTPSISSLLLPTLLFIHLWALRVPEPALISIPHNTVYLLRYWQKGREARMKGRVGKRKDEAEKAGKWGRERGLGNRKRGRNDSENQRALRLSHTGCMA